MAPVGASVPDLTGISKLSRRELEDEIHQLRAEVQRQTKAGNESREQAKQLGAKLVRALAGTSATDIHKQDSNIRLQELQHQNSLLKNKLQSAQHQLRSLSRMPLAPSYGRRGGQRPRTASAAPSPGPSSVSIPPLQQLTRPQTASYSVGRLAELENRVRELERDKAFLQKELDAKGLQPPPPILNAADQRAVVRENVEVLRLQRQVREKSAQLSQSQIRAGNLDQELIGLKSRYDGLVTELEELGRQLRAAHNRAEQLQAQLSAAAVTASAGSTHPSELEVESLRRENESLKSANEELIANSFNTERDAEWGSRERELKSRIKELEHLVKSDVALRQDLLSQLAKATGEKEEAQSTLHRREAEELKIRAALERAQKRLDILATKGLEWNEDESVYKTTSERPPPFLQSSKAVSMEEKEGRKSIGLEWNEDESVYKTTSERPPPFLQSSKAVSMEEKEGRKSIGLEWNEDESVYKTTSERPPPFLQSSKAVSMEEKEGRKSIGLEWNEDESVYKTTSERPPPFLQSSKAVSMEEKEGRKSIGLEWNEDESVYKTTSERPPPFLQSSKAVSMEEKEGRKSIGLEWNEDESVYKTTSERPPPFLQSSKAVSMKEKEGRKSIGLEWNEDESVYKTTSERPPPFLQSSKAVSMEEKEGRKSIGLEWNEDESVYKTTSERPPPFLQSSKAVSMEEKEGRKSIGLEWNEDESVYKTTSERPPPFLQSSKAVSMEEKEVNERRLEQLELSLLETGQELEKTRNLLLAQYAINAEAQAEVESACRLQEEHKRRFEQQLAQYAHQLDTRAMRIQRLEGQLRGIASGAHGSLPRPPITPTQDDLPASGPPWREEGSVLKVGESRLGGGENEVRVHLGRLELSREALSAMGTTSPSLFLSLEFFNFQLQFTPPVAGPEYVHLGRLELSREALSAMGTTSPSLFLSLEFFNFQLQFTPPVAGPEYVHLGRLELSREALSAMGTTSPSLFLSLEFFNFQLQFTPPVAGPEYVHLGRLELSREALSAMGTTSPSLFLSLEFFNFQLQFTPPVAGPEYVHLGRLELSREALSAMGTTSPSLFLSLEFFNFQLQFTPPVAGPEYGHLGRLELSREALSAMGTTSPSLFLSLEFFNFQLQFTPPVAGPEYVHLGRLELSREALSAMGTTSPSLFLSLEFFNFQLQFTPPVAGPEYVHLGRLELSREALSAMGTTSPSLFLSLEFFNFQLQFTPPVAGPEYVHLGRLELSREALSAMGTTSPSLFLSLEFFNFQLQFTPPVAGPEYVHLGRLELSREALSAMETTSPSLFLSLEFFNFQLQFTPPVAGPEYVHLGRLELSREALSAMGTTSPSLFLSLEFFNFQLQFTPPVAGPEYVHLGRLELSREALSAMGTTSPSLFLSLEFFNFQLQFTPPVAGPEYVHLGRLELSREALSAMGTTSPSLFLSLEFFNFQLQFTPPVAGPEYVHLGRLELSREALSAMGTTSPSLFLSLEFFNFQLQFTPPVAGPEYVHLGRLELSREALSAMGTTSPSLFLSLEFFNFQLQFTPPVAGPEYVHLGRLELSREALSAMGTTSPSLFLSLEFFNFQLQFTPPVAGPEYVHLGRLELSREALSAMGTTSPSLFLSLEFFNFQLQFTPPVAGPEYVHLGRLELSREALSAMGTTSPSLFLSLEFFNFQLQFTPPVAGPEYVHLGRLELSREPLSAMGTTSPSLFLSLEFFNFQLQFTPPVAGPEYVHLGRLELSREALSAMETTSPSLFLSLEFFNFQLQFTPPVAGPEYVHLGRLELSREALSAMGTTSPSLFLSLEFFNFQLQFTPPVAGPEADVNFTCYYLVTMSDLFMYSLQTDGLWVELHEACGARYRSWGGGTVALSGLLNTTEAAGSVELAGLPETNIAGVPIARLSFAASFRVPLHQSLSLYKERLVAMGFVGSVGEEAETGAQELVVTVHRCRDLPPHKDEPPSAYVSYAFWDLKPHSTATVHRNAEPEFRDSKTWTLAVSNQLDHYLRLGSVVFLVFNDAAESDEESLIGTVQIPLLALAHNKPIQGAYHITQEKGEAVGWIDVSLAWRYDYIPPKGTRELRLPPQEVELAPEEAITIPDLHKDTDPPEVHVRAPIGPSPLPPTRPPPSQPIAAITTVSKFPPFVPVFVQPCCPQVTPQPQQDSAPQLEPEREQLEPQPPSRDQASLSDLKSPSEDVEEEIILPPEPPRREGSFTIPSAPPVQEKEGEEDVPKAPEQALLTEDDRTSTGSSSVVTGPATAPTAPPRRKVRIDSVPQQLGPTPSPPRSEEEEEEAEVPPKPESSESETTDEDLVLGASSSQGLASPSVAQLAKAEDVEREISVGIGRLRAGEALGRLETAVFVNAEVFGEVGEEVETPSLDPPFPTNLIFDFVKSTSSISVGIGRQKAGEALGRLETAVFVNAEVFGEVGEEVETPSLDPPFPTNLIFDFVKSTSSISVGIGRLKAGEALGRLETAVFVNAEVFGEVGEEVETPSLDPPFPTNLIFDFVKSTSSISVGIGRLKAGEALGRLETAVFVNAEVFGEVGEEVETPSLDPPFPTNLIFDFVKSTSSISVGIGRLKAGEALGRLETAVFVNAEVLGEVGEEVETPSLDPPFPTNLIFDFVKSTSSISVGIGRLKAGEALGRLETAVFVNAEVFGEVGEEVETPSLDPTFPTNLIFDFVKSTSSISVGIGRLKAGEALGRLETAVFVNAEVFGEVGEEVETPSLDPPFLTNLIFDFVKSTSSISVGIGRLKAGEALGRLETAVFVNAEVFGEVGEEVETPSLDPPFPTNLIFDFVKSTSSISVGIGRLKAGEALGRMETAVFVNAEVFGEVGEEVETPSLDPPFPTNLIFDFVKSTSSISVGIGRLKAGEALGRLETAVFVNAEVFGEVGEEVETPSLDPPFPTNLIFDFVKSTSSISVGIGRLKAGEALGRLETAVFVNAEVFGEVREEVETPSLDPPFPTNLIFDFVKSTSSISVGIGRLKAGEALGRLETAVFVNAEVFGEVGEEVETPSLDPPFPTNLIFDFVKSTSSISVGIGRLKAGEALGRLETAVFVNAEVLGEVGEEVETPSLDPPFPTNLIFDFVKSTSSISVGIGRLKAEEALGRLETAVFVNAEVFGEVGEEVETPSLDPPFPTNLIFDFVKSTSSISVGIGRLKAGEALGRLETAVFVNAEVFGEVGEEVETRSLDPPFPTNLILDFVKSTCSISVGIVRLKAGEALSRLETAVFVIAEVFGEVGEEVETPSLDPPFPTNLIFDFVKSTSSISVGIGRLKAGEALGRLETAVFVNAEVFGEVGEEVETRSLDPPFPTNLILDFVKSTCSISVGIVRLKAGEALSRLETAVFVNAEVFGEVGEEVETPSLDPPFPTNLILDFVKSTCSISVGIVRLKAGEALSRLETAVFVNAEVFGEVGEEVETPSLDPPFPTNLILDFVKSTCSISVGIVRLKAGEALSRLETAVFVNAEVFGEVGEEVETRSLDPPFPTNLILDLVKSTCSISVGIVRLKAGEALSRLETAVFVNAEVFGEVGEEVETPSPDPPFPTNLILDFVKSTCSISVGIVRLKAGEALSRLETAVFVNAEVFGEVGEEVETRSLDPPFPTNLILDFVKSTCSISVGIVRLKAGEALSRLETAVFVNAEVFGEVGEEVETPSLDPPFPTNLILDFVKSTCSISVGIVRLKAGEALSRLETAVFVNAEVFGEVGEEVETRSLDPPFPTNLILDFVKSTCSISVGIVRLKAGEALSRLETAVFVNAEVFGEVGEEVETPSLDPPFPTNLILDFVKSTCSISVGIVRLKAGEALSRLETAVFVNAEVFGEVGEEVETRSLDPPFPTNLILDFVKSTCSISVGIVRLKAGEALSRLETAVFVNAEVFGEVGEEVETPSLDPPFPTNLILDFVKSTCSISVGIVRLKAGEALSRLETAVFVNAEVFGEVGEEVETRSLDPPFPTNLILDFVKSTCSISVGIVRLKAGEALSRLETAVFVNAEVFGEVGEEVETPSLDPPFPTNLILDFVKSTCSISVGIVRLKAGEALSRLETAVFVNAEVFGEVGEEVETPSLDPPFPTNLILDFVKSTCSISVGIVRLKAGEALSRLETAVFVNAEVFGEVGEEVETPSLDPPFPTNLILDFVKSTCSISVGIVRLKAGEALSRLETAVFVNAEVFGEVGEEVETPSLDPPFPTNLILDFVKSTCSISVGIVRLKAGEALSRLETAVFVNAEVFGEVGEEVETPSLDPPFPTNLILDFVKSTCSISVGIVRLKAGEALSRLETAVFVNAEVFGEVGEEVETPSLDPPFPTNLILDFVKSTCSISVGIVRLKAGEALGRLETAVFVNAEVFGEVGEEVETPSLDPPFPTNLILDFVKSTCSISVGIVRLKAGEALGRLETAVFVNAEVFGEVGEEVETPSLDPPFPTNLILDFVKSTCSISVGIVRLKAGEALSRLETAVFVNAEVFGEVGEEVETPSLDPPFPTNLIFDFVKTIPMNAKRLDLLNKMRFQNKSINFVLTSNPKGGAKCEDLASISIPVKEIFDSGLNILQRMFPLRGSDGSHYGDLEVTVKAQAALQLAALG